MFDFLNLFEPTDFSNLFCFLESGAVPEGDAGRLAGREIGEGGLAMLATGSSGVDCAEGGGREQGDICSSEMMKDAVDASSNVLRARMLYPRRNHIVFSDTGWVGAQGSSGVLPKMRDPVTTHASCSALFGCPPLHAEAFGIAASSAFVCAIPAAAHVENEGSRSLSTAIFLFLDTVSHLLKWNWFVM